MNNLNEADLMTVTGDLLQKAATTGDKEYAKLAGEYSRLVIDLKKVQNEETQLSLNREVEERKLKMEKQIADRAFKMDIVKLVGFIGVTVSGVAIENKYMVSSWFTKTFIQKNSPKV